MIDNHGVSIVPVLTTMVRAARHLPKKIVFLETSLLKRRTILGVAVRDRSILNAITVPGMPLIHVTAVRRIVWFDGNDTEQSIKQPTTHCEIENQHSILFTYRRLRHILRGDTAGLSRGSGCIVAGAARIAAGL